MRSPYFCCSTVRVRRGAAVTVCAVSLLFLWGTMGSARGQTFTVLYSFKASPDGDEPLSGVIRDAEGNLHGTTYYGGAYGNGIVFKVDKHGNETVLYNFAGGSDGENPIGGLVRDAAGNLYGATDGGGYPDCGEGSTCGTVYKVDTYGKETVLYRFRGLPDGHSADSSLLLDKDGNLYGTTEAGGDNGCNPGYGCGTVFKIDTNGRESILHTFAGSGKLDGAFPDAALVADAEGYLYSTTSLGGAPTCLDANRAPSNAGGCGTVFKIDKRGNETVLHRFSTVIAGTGPSFPIMLDSHGNIYSTTPGGGSLYNGLVFELSNRGQEKVLYNFSVDQGFPSAGLVRDDEGNLYGTLRYIGFICYGSVYKLGKTGEISFLHSFSGGGDGGCPDGTLAMDGEGNLYGTARDGGNHDCGQYGCGVVFKITP
jgi:uncharacterized repeat protein (TIGR03803 family)